MATFFRRLRARLKYRRHAEELSRELDVHRAMAEDELRDDGAAGGDVRWKAARLIGNETLAREDARAVWVTRGWEQAIQDIRYALRGFRRTPVFTITALLTLVAAIGLNASVFTAINAVLLRPWPVANSHTVVSAFAGRGQAAAPVYGGWPYVEYRYLREHARTVDLVAMRDERLTFGYQAVGDTEQVRAASANYFATLGVPVALGRGFEPGDEDGPHAVTVLADRIWREHYGARPGLVGETVPLNGVPFMVIGIAAPGAGDNPLDPPAAAWIPFASLPLIGGEKSQMDVLTSPTACCQDVAGRLGAGHTKADASAELTGLSRQFRGEHNLPFLGVQVTGTALMDTPRRSTATPVFGLLLAGVTLLLALACANVGNLVLARSMARVNEMRVRLSLGAGRARLMRQLLVENLVLAALAAVAAIPIVYWLPGAILSSVSPLTAWGLNLDPDAKVFAYVAVTVALAAVFFGLAPATRVTRVTARLVSGARGGADRGTARLRLGLLASQIAIGSVLLVVSVLLGRGIAQVADVPIGFERAGVSIATVWLPVGTYDGARANALAQTLLDSVTPAGTPALAARVSVPPLQSGRVTASVRRPGDTDDAARTVGWEEVSPEFFDVIGIPIVDGRADLRTLAPDEVVIDAQLAAALGGDMLGRTIALGSGRTFRVAAIARHARIAAIDEDQSTVYRVGASERALDRPATQLNFLFRGANAQAALTRAVASVDSRMRVTVRDLEANLRDQLRPSQVGAAIAGALGLIAAVVSAIGVFGVFSYLVISRQREVGIRLALGARGRTAVAAVLRTAILALAAGLAIGMAAALVVVPALRGYLFGLSPFDPAAFGGAALLLVVVAAGALIGPVRAVLRTNPAATLRAE